MNARAKTMAVADEKAAEEKAAIDCEVANLGIDHRDIISIPERDRFNNASVATSFEQHDSRRRERAHEQARADPGNELHAKTSLWNKPELFPKDSMAEDLPNAYCGQGHREHLMSMKLQEQDEQYKANRGGPRASRGGSGHVAGDGSASSRPSFAAAYSTNGSYTQKNNHAGLSNSKGLPPRLPSKTPMQFNAKAKAPTTSTPATRTQAPLSTHSRGQTDPPQFTPVKMATNNTESTQPRMPITSADVLSTPSTLGPRRAMTCSMPPATRTTEIQNGPSVPVRLSATANTSGHGIESAHSASDDISPSANGTATIVRVLRSPASAPPAPNTAGATHDHYRNIVYIKMAEHYAKNPGLERDTYYTKFPDRLPYLEVALKQLAETAENDAQKVEEVEKEKITKEATKKEAAVLEQKTSKTTAKKEPAGDAAKTETSQAPIEQQPDLPSEEPGSQNFPLSVHSSPRSVARVASEFTGIPRPVAPSTSPMYGKLVVTYLDVESNHLDTLSIDVNAPVQVSVQVSSKATAYDPRVLLAAAQAFGNLLCLNDQRIRLRRTADGLWEELPPDGDKGAVSAGV